MWTAPERSAQARLLYEKAERDRLEHPERYQLTSETVLAAAFEKHPLPDDDNGDWQEGLSVYLQSARTEGNLNALGARNVIASASGRLKARASIDRAMKSRPKTQDRQLDRPIFIIGGWRTGTTLLQRLLSQLPGLRGLYPAELTAPWRFAGLDQQERDAALSAGEGAHDRLHILNPAMWAIHPSGARLAEECVLAMGSDMRNWGFTSTLRCPTYADWLLGQDFKSSYQRYADILRLLQDDSGDRWILKAPAHTVQLDALICAFPDACIIHLHRDVVQTVTSGSSLFAVFRSTYSDRVDPCDVGQYQLDMTARWFDRAMQARERHPDAVVLDIAFSDLAADPTATARQICARFGIDWTPATDLAADLASARANAQHVKLRTAPEDFGLTAGLIRERLASYRERFGVN